MHASGVGVNIHQVLLYKRAAFGGGGGGGGGLSP